MMVRLLFSIFAVFCLGAPAQAQFDFGGDAPILIDAEQATYKNNVTVLTGKVDVRQGDAQILSDEMKIFRAAGQNGVDGSLGLVTRIEASGNFRYITPENTVSGDRGVYIRESGKITVTGNVQLVQPSGSRVRGDKLTYSIQTKSAKFGDECVGEGCNGRVTFDIKQ